MKNDRAKQDVLDETCSVVGMLQGIYRTWSSDLPTIARVFRKKEKKKKLNRNMSHVINLAALPNSSSLIP